jgi:hypothetical protein
MSTVCHLEIDDVHVNAPAILSARLIVTRLTPAMGAIIIAMPFPCIYASVSISVIVVVLDIIAAAADVIELGWAIASLALAAAKYSGLGRR